MIPVFRIHEKTIRLVTSEYPIKAPNMLVFTNNQTILPFLRAFGHLITSLQYVTKSEVSVENIEQISNYIMQYCSDTIIELDLGSRSASLITSSNNVFKSLTILKLRYWHSFDDTDINRNFPMLEDLTFETCFPIPDSMFQFYPKLQRLRFESSPASMNFAAITEILRFNRQLRELSIVAVPPFELLEFISTELMDLEHLSFHYKTNGIFVRRSDKVHFENLKSFSIRMNDWFGAPHQAPITFGRLETLEILTYDADIPINLVKDNFELKSISLPQANTAAAKEILMQAGPFRGLEEIKMQWADAEDNLNVREIMERFESLQRIILIVHVFGGDNINLDLVKRNFENEDGWKVTDHKFAGQHSGFDFYYVTLRK